MGRIFNKPKSLWLYLYIIFYGFIFLYQLISTDIRKQKSFEYFSIDCAIYNRGGQLIYRQDDAYLCAYHNSGSIIKSDPIRGKLTLIDKYDKPIWVSNENVHHMINFTPDMQRVLLLSSETVKINKVDVRSDCVSVRDLNNTKIHEWCMGDHLSELQKLGYDVTKFWDIGFKMRYKNETMDKEISHANSFHQIPKNQLENIIPAFAEGNYILHLYGPTRALLVLDNKLQKILWHKKMGKFIFDRKEYDIHTHDNQITSAGNLLSYFSTVEYNTPARSAFKNIFDVNLGLFCCYAKVKPHSRVVEINLLDNKVVWQYKDNPVEKFYSPISPNVTLLNNGNFIFDEGFMVYEVNRSGAIVWKFKNPARNAGYPRSIMSLKALEDLSFLRARGLVN